MDKVSVIMPVFNAEKFLKDAIRSVLSQTYENLELLIVDDCSNDNSLQICNDFKEKDSRVKVFKNDLNRGTGFSRNFALEKATGRYISFLDADDIWKENKLEKQVNFMTEFSVPITFCFYELIDENGDSKNLIVKAPTVLTYKKLLKNNYIGNLTGIYDTQTFGKVEISNIRKRQDWLMWLQLLKIVKICYPVEESLAFYRKVENSISSNKFRLLKHNFNVYRSGLNFNYLQSIVWMFIFLVEYLFVRKSYIKTQ
jgi:glycosyltransferase involved in cell wall biosynthesis